MSIYKKQIIGGFWRVSKPLARHFQCIHTAIILDELIFHELKHAGVDGWFFFNAAEIEENCMVGRKQREASIKKLVDSQILRIERRGLPCRNWYLINGDAIDLIISPKPEQSTMSSKEHTLKSLEKSPSVSPEEHTFIKKVFSKKLNEEVIVVDEPAPTSTILKSDFEQAKAYFISVPYYKRIKAPGAIRNVFRHYGSFESIKLAYDSLWNKYALKKRYPLQDEEKQNQWHIDCYSFIENALIKEARI